MTFRSTEMRMRERLDSNRVEGGREANMWSGVEWGTEGSYQIRAVMK